MGSEINAIIDDEMYNLICLGDTDATVISAYGFGVHFTCQ
jgi:hypothetical protein